MKIHEFVNLNLPKKLSVLLPKEIQKTLKSDEDSPNYMEAVIAALLIENNKQPDLADRLAVRHALLTLQDVLLTNRSNEDVELIKENSTSFMKYFQEVGAELNSSANNLFSNPTCLGSRVIYVMYFALCTVTSGQGPESLLHSIYPSGLTSEQIAHISDHSAEAKNFLKLIATKPINFVSDVSVVDQIVYHRGRVDAARLKLEKVLLSKPRVTSLFSDNNFFELQFTRLQHLFATGDELLTCLASGTKKQLEKDCQLVFEKVDRKVLEKLLLPNGDIDTAISAASTAYSENDNLNRAKGFFLTKFKQQSRSGQGYRTGALFKYIPYANTVGDLLQVPTESTKNLFYDAFTKFLFSDFKLTEWKSFYEKYEPDLALAFTPLEISNLEQDLEKKTAAIQKMKSEINGAITDYNGTAKNLIKWADNSGKSEFIVSEEFILINNSMKQEVL